MSRWLTNKWESLKNWGLNAGRSSKEFMVEWNMYSAQTYVKFYFMPFSATLRRKMAWHVKSGS